MLCTTCQAIKDNPSAVVLHERCRIGKFVKPDVDLRFSGAGEGRMSLLEGFMSFICDDVSTAESHT